MTCANCLAIPIFYAQALRRLMRSLRRNYGDRPPPRRHSSKFAADLLKLKILMRRGNQLRMTGWCVALFASIGFSLFGSLSARSESFYDRHVFFDNSLPDGS